MAKQSYGILDGYRGTVGPVIGYQWRGRWCLRARPRQVSNPRTVAQQEHRMVFRDMVQLAGLMKTALRQGLRTASLEEQMTECNLFVKMNKSRFTPRGVDYAALELSRGPVAPVAFTAAAVDADNVLRVSFEKNPLHLRAGSEDHVLVFAFCPALREGRLSAPVYRRDRRLEMALPDEWTGQELHFYGFVTDYQQRASETLYIDVDAEDSMDDNRTTNDYETDICNDYYAAGGFDSHGAAGVGLGMEGRREDGDADARGRGAGGSGADPGRG